MNKRLKRILSYIEDGIGMIDVGTDHGYLPTELALLGYSGNILSSDINPGPLDAARRTAKASGVDSKIRFLLCDGLEQCPPDAIDTIVIAGMGGDTICGILDRAEWCMDKRYKLILQPMTRAEVLRYWLVYNEFQIVHEDLVDDSGEIYQVLVARFGGATTLSDAELYTGSFEVIRYHPLFKDFLGRQIKRFERTVQGLRSASIPDKSGKLEITETILEQLMEMKKDGNR